MSPRMAIVLGAFWAGIAVTLGAFGAHLLEGQLPIWYSEAAIVERMRHTWEVGVRYQTYHAIGLILLGLWGEQRVSRRITCSGLLLLIGNGIFSGCLYLLVLFGERKLGMVVPIGGFVMIAGWLHWSWQAGSELESKG